MAKTENEAAVEDIPGCLLHIIRICVGGKPTKFENHVSTMHVLTFFSVPVRLFKLNETCSGKELNASSLAMYHVTNHLIMDPQDPICQTV